MNINIEYKGRMLCVNPEGRLDAHGSVELQEVWNKNKKPETLCVVLNMKKVDYLSSAGLRILLIMYKALRQKGGILALAELNPYCHNVIEVAGFAESFPIYNTYTEAVAGCEILIHQVEYLDNWDNLETFQLSCGSVKVIPASQDLGVINVLGDVKNVLYSRVQDSDLCSKRFSETEYSIGLGGLGDQIDDYFPIMGEMITIGGTMVWLPTDGYDTPDFLIPKVDKGQVTLRTGFNVSIGGHFNEILMFTSNQDGGTSISELYRAIFNLSKSRRKDYHGVLGLALCADMSKVLGSGIKKSPIINFAPANGEMITHPSNFKDWFDSDTIPRHENVTALICGVGVDLTSDLSSYDNELFNLVFYLHPSNIGAKTELLHNHAVIFKKIPISERTVCLETEIQKLVDEGEFIDMRHLIDSSALTRAFIGVSYIQTFRHDPTGVRGV